jgi:putative addiction module component (TIGR02574 family)
MTFFTGQANIGSMSLETEFIDKALSLPEHDRAELAERLLSSLPAASPTETLDETFAAEIERRLSQVERNEVVTVPWRESIERARLSLRKGTAG